MKINDFDLIIGRKILIVSCKRSDGADAFDDIEAIVDEVFDDGGVALALKNGESLVISNHNIHYLKYRLL